MPEIGEVRYRIAQLVEQRRIELVALERGKRVGVEADRPIDLTHAIAHPANDFDQQRGRGARNFDERAASDAKSGDGRARARGCGALEFCERAQFPDQTGRVQRGYGDDAASAVDGDGHLTRQNEHGAIARLSLDHEDRAGIEGQELADINQERDVGFGEVAECARRPDGGAQLRGIFHIIM